MQNPNWASFGDIEDLRSEYLFSRAHDSRLKLEEPMVGALCAMFDNVADAALIVRVQVGENSIAYVNKSFEELTGHIREDAIKMELDQLISDRTTGPNRSAVTVAFKEVSSTTVSVFLSTNNGWSKRCRLHIDPLPVLWFDELCFMVRLEPMYGVGAIGDEDPEARMEMGEKLIDALGHAQNKFLESQDSFQAFEGLLESLLNLTESEYGFIGEVLYDGDVPYLKTHAITNIAWDKQTRDFYDTNAPQGLEFKNLETLFGQAIKTGEVVIANDPLNDRRAAGRPKGHPQLNSFLGVPFFNGDDMVGMVGIANKDGGYDQTLVDYLRPFFTTCSQIIVSNRLRRS